MARELDSIDTRILDQIQSEVPLEPHPFRVIASRVDASEDDVLCRIEALKAPPRPVIRQISAIFDSKSLGYQSTLVAAMIDEARLDEAVAVINQHPGVSHNYRRNNAFNLWYTLAVPPHSKLGLEKTLQVLHDLSGSKSTRMMPTLRLFKIGVKLDLSGGDPSGRTDVPVFSAEQQDAACQIPVTEADKRMIRVMQRNLPVISRPFDGWAQEAGVTLTELLDSARQYIAEKRMRRFSAVLKHREVGFSANGMGVWDVPKEQREAFGRTAASFSAVSHCYERPSYPDWPYSMFTMVHAPTQEQCDGVLQSISQATGITRYGALYSSHEYKKVRIQYFAGDIEAWEESHLAAAVV